MGDMDSSKGFVVGERVTLTDKTMAGDARKISAEVIEVREILGMQTFVVETETGKRKVVNANQLSKLGAS